jgi:ATP-dependent Lon protease
MTDGTQNNTFHDKYFSGINIDLSRVLFFFSFNDIEKINPILIEKLYL